MTENKLIQPNTKTPQVTVKQWKGTLNQSGGAFTQNVLKNTIGAIVWTNTSNGLYTGTLTGAFPADKTYYTVQDVTDYTASGAKMIAKRISDDVIQVQISNGGVGTQNLLVNAPFYIEVWP